MNLKLSPLAKAADALRAAADALDEAERQEPAIKPVPLSSDPFLPPLPSPDEHLTLDPRTMRVTWRGVDVEDLTVRLFKVLDYLQKRPDVVRTRDELLDLFWPDQFEVDARAVDSAMKRIRQAFRRVDPSFERVQTVYGLGYKWQLIRE